MSLACFQSSCNLLASCFAVFFLVLLQTKIATSALIMSMRNHHNNYHHRRPMLHTNQSTCALFVGSWVRDESYPLYQSSNCPTIIDAEFNCQMYGRPDSEYLKYRWQPLNCELPRFNGLEFLLKMRGKSIMFVGDSLGRNQWESLICMVSSSVPRTSTQMSRGDPFSIFKFSEYDVTISFYKAPYLVDIDVVQGKRVLRLEEISGNANAWRNADVLMFNTGHWWSHKGSLQGWDYMESGGTYYKDMDRLVALERGLGTWAKWVDANIDTTRTRVFFQSISPTHYNPSEWSAGTTTATTKNCYGETAPVSGSTYPGEYPDQMRVVDTVIRGMQNPAYLLDITMLSELRKDGHPSIYSGDLSPQQRANPDRSADCSHWCLPGLPDTWNQLLYTALFF
ncbi:protein PMR5-like [Populus nigra]|uniref:protein PMR5-like n=1 Tax=Populus nigra TaxID=3691 RepID=UPI002B27C074|nr:protein PMR5-like [Populus nigra]